MLLKGVLKEVGITHQDHLELFNASIKNSSNADKLVTAFNTLKDTGITLPDHLELYEVSIKNAYSADKYATTFKALKEAGAIPKDHSVLYNLVIQSVDDSLFFCLNKMALLGLQVPDSLDIIEQALNENKLALDTFTGLDTNQMIKKTHDDIYEDCFLEKNALLHSPYNWSKVKINHELYFKNNPLYSEKEESYPAQHQDTQVIMNEEITEGPLNKTSETRALEAILQRIAIEEIEAIHMRYDESLGYILQFGEAPEIYLSELLRLANFNHVTLSETQVALLGDKIKARSPGFLLKKMPDTNRIIQKLPLAARCALACYLGNRYKNINRLFRGVAQTKEEEYTWLKPAHATNNLMVNFLAGSLVNWAAAELPRILIATPELTALFPTYGLVDRGENLEASQKDELRIRESRLANPVVASSVQSFSVLSGGAPFFHGASAERTTLACSIRPVINNREGEILIPQGTTYLYKTNPAGGFFAREVNSPGIIPDGGQWSATAIAEAYRNHLRNNYKSSTHQTTIDNKTIYRPNHGLAHTYRVMLYIDVVIDYFAHHAEDEMFRLFCQYITPEEREWLRVAAAYSITGRENEMSAGEDLKQYDKFREASMQHMAAFLKKYPPKTYNPHMQERMLDIVRWMGNPGYETASHGQPCINVHDDSGEREHRNILHRILTTAHKLDLPRCYAPEQFNAAMSMCRTLSTNSQEQQADYLRMIRYAVALNNAHGNALATAVSPSDELKPCLEPYRSPFGLVSTNLRQLREMTNTVSRLKLLESYQFPSCEDGELKKRVLKMCGVSDNRPPSGRQRSFTI